MTAVSNSGIELAELSLPAPHDDDAPFPAETSEALLIEPVEASKAKSTRFFWEMLTCMLLLLASESSRGLIVTELPDYVLRLGGSKTFLSACVAAFSLGRLPASIVFGWWSERHGARFVLQISLAIAIMGNILYCLAASLQCRWVLLLGRLLAGFGTGNFSVVRAHIAAITTRGERTRYLGWGGAMQFVGFGLMPSVAGLLATVRFGPSWLPLTGNTLPGWILVAMYSSLLICAGMLSMEKAKTSTPKGGSSSGALPTNTLAVVWICIVLNFLARGILSLIEVLGPYDFPIVWQDNDDDMQADLAQFFTLLGAAGLVIYIGIDFLPKKYFPELWQLIAGFLALSIGAYIFSLWGTVFSGFAVATVFMWSVGSPVTQTLTLAIFSKILANHPQGMWMGIMGSAGSLGRIAFPFATMLPESVAFAIGGTLSWMTAAALLLGVRMKWVTIEVSD